MYQFSGKLKTFSLALIILGLVGIAYSFYDGSQKTLADAEHAIEAAHSNDHGNSHETTTDAHKENNHSTTVASETHGDSHDTDHAEHVLHQLKNRPWSALYVSLFFFLGISLLVLAFYAAQRVAQSGWSIVLFRVMESITANLVPTSIIMLLVIVAAVMHWNHMFPWMAEGTFTPGHENYDAIVDGKSWWMNVSGWAIRGIVY